jgi:H2-forming N5,N10-methylenetetrahydromethanopterin dehydrogenase-like enzyme
MVVLLEIALVLGLLGIVGSYFFRGRRIAERQEVIERRVEAYMQTIRREGGGSELAAMSDVELKDLLLSSARNLRVQAERKWYILLGSGAAALLAAIAIGTEEGTRGFGIVLLVAAVALYGINEFMGRRMREPLVARGIDVERLRVE